MVFQRFCPQGSEIFLSPLVAKLEHCPFDFAPDLKTLGVRRLCYKDTFCYCSAYKACTFVTTDFDKGCLAGLVADDTPVTAGEVCLAGILYLQRRQLDLRRNLPLRARR